MGGMILTLVLTVLIFGWTVALWIMVTSPLWAIPALICAVVMAASAYEEIFE